LQYNSTHIIYHLYTYVTQGVGSNNLGYIFKNVNFVGNFHFMAIYQSSIFFNWYGINAFYLLIILEVHIYLMTALVTIEKSHNSILHQSCFSGYTVIYIELEQWCT